MRRPSRQWLIEVMTKHVCGARIQYFATNILPLARQVLEKSQQLADAGFEVGTVGGVMLLLPHPDLLGRVYL